MKEKVVEYMPAKFVIGTAKIPDGVKIVHEKAVCNASGLTGALIKHLNTGMYSLYSCGTLFGIDQRFAKKIAEI